MSKVLTALIAGIAIGILVAPRKGSETRKKIIDGASNLQDDIHDFITETTETLKSGFASAETQAKDLFEKGKEQAGRFGKEFKN
jgi:gas vesicle protein